ncbi:hypothetical protein BHYA_0133g00270 [Botrytis hyacinthi]|uniref:Uncharacterized protein n=1 Tax=Botrytis hyacinthi TaxID=278943 RepID=A0A4Z1GHK1_9HELO|nr:hypothetical protein BHYA_0133g00270 [Botrytis hyacinthi]
MTAPEGEGWSLLFVCVFLLWLLLLPIGVILSTGMNPLGILDITKYLQLFFINGFPQFWTVDSELVLAYRTYQRLTCMA